jgi:hypothetical protein
VQQGREEGGVDGVEVLQRQGRGAESLEAEEVLVQEGIFVFLSI